MEDGGASRREAAPPEQAGPAERCWAMIALLVEALFKAFARALRVACGKDDRQLPSTKGLL